jgi:hypothetical protein
VVASFGNLAERLSDVASDRRLLGNDERLGHEGLESNPVMAFLQARSEIRAGSQKIVAFGSPWLMPV